MIPPSLFFHIYIYKYIYIYKSIHVRWISQDLGNPPAAPRLAVHAVPPNRSIRKGLRMTRFHVAAATQSTRLTVSGGLQFT